MDPKLVGHLLEGHPQKGRQTYRISHLVVLCYRRPLLAGVWGRNELALASHGEGQTARQQTATRKLKNPGVGLMAWGLWLGRS